MPLFTDAVQVWQIKKVLPFLHCRLVPEVASLQHTSCFQTQACLEAQQHDDFWSASFTVIHVTTSSNMELQKQWNYALIDT